MKRLKLPTPGTTTAAGYNIFHPYSLSTSYHFLSTDAQENLLIKIVSISSNTYLLIYFCLALALSPKTK